MFVVLAFRFGDLENKKNKCVKYVCVCVYIYIYL